MKRINLNEMAKDITLAEGGKVNLPIGQVKEVIRLALEWMGHAWNDGRETGIIEAMKAKAAKRK